MGFQWLDIARQIQSIAQAGLTYSEGKYDIDRYNQLMELSVRILTEYSDGSETQLTNLLKSETGYLTPKVDVRAVVFKDNKILMVRETIDGNWSLPGGWCDVGLTPKENAEKEVWEESGLKVKAKRLLAVFDKKCHEHPEEIYYTYKLFILCNIEGGELNPGMETSDVNFFPIDNLPPLSVGRNTKSQIETMFTFLTDPDRDVLLD